jgi:lipopolysaccharide heptosyltransferase I
LKVLILRLSSIGDVVHTLPLLSVLHRQGHQLGWLVEPAARPLLDGHPYLHRLVSAPSSRRFRVGAARRALSDLRGERWEVALDVQGLWKSAVWGRLARPGRLIGYSSRWRRESSSAVLLHEAIPPPPPRAHVIDEYLRLAEPLGIQAAGAREFAFPPTGAQAGRVEAGLRRLGLAAPYAVLNPAGGWPEKLWPAERYGALARGLRERGLVPLVTYGPGEEALADRVVASSSGAAQRCFDTTLLEYLELVRRARLVVAGDTGPLHLACAVGTPVVGLYGPTDPARNGPFDPRDVVVRRVGPPDPRHGGRLQVSPEQMAAIPAEEVLAAVDRRLALAVGARAV